MEEGKQSFNTVAFVLFAIWMACMVFPGLSLKSIPVKSVALALLLFVAFPHAVGLYLSIRQNHTEAAIIIGLFLSFWLFLGIGFFILSPLEVSETLKFIEPGMAIAVFCLQYFYKDKDKSLQYILIGLGTTITYLWLSKFVLWLESGVPYVVWGLGICTLVVAIHQLRKLRKSNKA